RSPRLMAVYVDLAALPSSRLTPTADDLRGHVLDSITGTDSAMRAKLDDSLRGENDRARWIFLFDSLDEIAVGWPTDQVRVLIAEFMTEVHRFLRPGDVRFNAIVATREYLMFPAGTPMIGIAPLSRHAQRKLMSSAGLGSIDQGRALDQF